MAVRVTCKNCGSKIVAKDELLGQTRRCPKCQSEVLVVPEGDSMAETSIPSGNTSIEYEKTFDKSSSVATENATTQSLPPAQEEPVVAQPADETPIVYGNLERLPTHDPPTKLSPNCRYFLFAHDQMTAFWEIGKGWQFYTGHGYVSARQNKDLLPTSGTFKFVEMILEQKKTGKQLTGIRTFSLAGKWAIPAIGREPEEILAKIDGKAVLTKQQRLQLLTYIRKNYMPDFLENSKAVYDYLICDFTSESDVFVD